MTATPVRSIVQCPKCGKPAKVNASHRKNGVKTRYHVCRHCGTHCKSIDGEIVFVGRIPHHGEHVSYSKLTCEHVREMRIMHELGASSYECAAAFDVEQKTAYDAIHRRTWKHVE